MTPIRAALDAAAATICATSPPCGDCRQLARDIVVEYLAALATVDTEACAVLRRLAREAADA